MLEERTHALLEAILQEIQHQDNYTYSDPLEVAGGTGNYLIASPYNEECEWALYASSCGGTGPGSFTISPRAAANDLQWNGTDTIGLASQGRMNNVMSGVSGKMAGNTVVPYTPMWVPLTGNAALYVAITAAASTTVTVTVVFRRQNNPVRFATRPQSGGHRMNGRQERHAAHAEAARVQPSFSELQEVSRRGEGLNGRAGIRR